MDDIELSDLKDGVLASLENEKYSRRFSVQEVCMNCDLDNASDNPIGSAVLPQGSSHHHSP